MSGTRHALKLLIHPHYLVTLTTSLTYRAEARRARRETDSRDQQIQRPKVAILTQAISRINSPPPEGWPKAGLVTCPSYFAPTCISAKFARLAVKMLVRFRLYF